MDKELKAEIEDVINMLQNADYPESISKSPREIANLLERTLQAQQWVGVATPPEKDCDVLTFHPDWGTGIARYKDGMGFDSSQILVPFVCPTLWQHLPADPT